MIKMFLGFVAALVLTSTAEAQLVDAARFVDPVSARGATLSPDGNYIAYIARTETDHRLIVVDLASQRARAVQAIPNGLGTILWAVWKGSDRLVLGANSHERIPGRAPIGSVLRNEERTLKFIASLR